MTAIMHAAGTATVLVAAMPIVLIALLLLRRMTLAEKPLRGAWLLLVPLAVLIGVQVAAELGVGEFLTALIFMMAGGVAQ
jgi:hypothetical protein